MNPNNDTPSIRFAGFTDAWEQRKLEECASYRRGSFPQPYGKKEWYDGDFAMPFVQVADVTEEMGLVENTKQKISKIAQSMSVFAEKNSVLVTLQGSIGRVAITQYEAFIDRTVLIFEKYTKKTDALFWAYVIKQKFTDEARSAPGGTIKTITKETLSSFDLHITSYAEQKKIGEIFRLIDRLITLHQSEYIFQKCFKFVFEFIFTLSWEQRKVSEIATFSKGTGYSKSDVRDKGTPLILYGRLYTKYETVIRDVDTFTLPKDGSVYSRGGEVIIPASGETAEDISIASVVEKSGVILGGDLNIVTPQSGIDSAFLALSISHGEAHRSLSKLAQGKSVVHIHNSDIQNVEVGMPVQVEQESISQFFEGVDRLITLHQRKNTHITQKTNYVK